MESPPLHGATAVHSDWDTIQHTDLCTQDLLQLVIARRTKANKKLDESPGLSTHLFLSLVVFFFSLRVPSCSGVSGRLPGRLPASETSSFSCFSCCFFSFLVSLLDFFGFSLGVASRSGSPAGVSPRPSPAASALSWPSWRLSLRVWPLQWAWPRG